MKAFHNDPAIKRKYLDRIATHRAADELIQGTGWQNGKGCAVGCTLETYDHKRYETELGLPEWLARLEDFIFEGLPKSEAMEWPEKFLSAVRVGADVERVKHQLGVRRMDRLIALQEKSTYPKKADVIAAITVVRRCHEAEANAQSCDWDSARSAADSARSAYSADSAARSAALSAALSARSAAFSALSAYSAYSAARSAALSAYSATYSAAWRLEATNLIELLEAA